ncbi:unnamed protein product [Rotaria socialis]|uniref:DOMON domain-containing protein n=1 Tax=Rotaria socialis TaxID=392032 RepID=A0A818K3K9_9BILA|nr:unnamed protein product [Rotaria socialis]CAF4524740.1 unnamed protein product [Rotaria socialis]
MTTMHHPLLVLIIILFIEIINCQVAFKSLCSSEEVEVAGMASVDGSNEFEIDLYQSKFLPEDTVSLSIKQKRRNYAINEFVLRAFDYDGNVIGRFDNTQTGDLTLNHHTCSNGANVVYADQVGSRGYSEVPLEWKATGIHHNLDQVVFRATVVSNRQLYRLISAPLKRRLSSEIIPYHDQSINIDYCGESQGCLIVPQQCNNDAKCDYALSWQAIDAETAKFHIVARAQGFVGVGFSNDEKRGDDQVILCTKDAEGYVYVHNMFVGVQTPQYVFRGRPSYGLREADSYSNATHIICKFSRSLSPHTENSGENDGRSRDRIDREKFVDLKKPHFMYPIYSDEGLMTAQGMRIPLQDIAIVNNHPVDFERRIWPKTHPQAASVLAKIHAILNIIAWVLLASAGVMVGRYFDSLWPDYERLTVVDSATGAVTGEKYQQRRRFSYFTIVPPLMIVVAILTWIAFFCILFELDWKWTYGTHHMWHSILGVVVLICAFFAPIVGVMRPIPRTKSYCVWYWIHWVIMSLAHCLAIPVIFLGMDNRRLDLWTWCSWLLFAWCIFHFIVQLIFEIHACCHARQEYDRLQGVEHYSEKNVELRIRKERIPGESWKPALLGIYLCITLVVVIILILAVIFYQGY